MINTHIIVDFYRANPEILAKDTKLKAAIDSALAKLKLRLRQDSYIQFDPEGVTATVVSDLFHFSIHTWPEFCSCAIDLYSSQEYSFAVEVTQALKESFEAEEHDLKINKRLSNLNKDS